jgi:TRAP-type C4-dicarboxylate transport system permease small subunit
MQQQIASDARRLATIGTFFIVAGWVFVIFAIAAGIIWWIDLASRDAFNVFEAFAISASAVGVPIFVAFVVAGFGYAIRLIALYIASKSV